MLYIVIYIIELCYKKFIFVVIDFLYIDGMKVFLVNKVIFIFVWSNNVKLCFIDVINYFWELFFLVKIVFVFVDDGCSCWLFYEYVLFGG